MPVVLYEKKDKIAYITLNRPDKRNSLSPDLIDELERVWIDFRDDDRLWVAILTGAGKAFCGGADISKFGGAQAVQSARPVKPPALMTTSPALLGTPTRYSIYKPIVAAINGYCMGAGMWLAMGCDFRIAADTAEFGLPEPRVGVPTTVAAVLPRYMSTTMAYELLLLAERMTARRAYEAGLVNRVVPADAVMESARQMAEKLCESSPLAVRAMKQVLQKCQDMTFEDALAYSQEVFAPVRAGEDAKEGQKAFLEKRKPVWKCK